MTVVDTGTILNTCPITLEPIEASALYQHAGIYFDVFAIYTFLTKSVYLVNPVTRTSFTLEELQGLEDKIKEVCGEDAIVYQSGSERDSDLISSTSCGDIETQVDMYYSSIDDDITVELQVVPIPDTTDNDDTIRLQVNLNVPYGSATGSTSGDSCDEDSADDVLFFEGSQLSNLSKSDLPPSRFYPSVVEMYQDTQRAARMKANMDLLQYLTYDSLDIVTQMVSLLCDEHFHQMVWEQTSPTVLDAINRIVADRNGSDTNIDVEITYSDCWESYRTQVLRVLIRRLSEVVQDMVVIDVSEANFCVISHIATIENNSSIPSERKVWLVNTLRELSM